MQILLTPDDIIKRCLWHNYKKFVLKNKKEVEINEIIKRNEITTINENDAYVIGLLKYIKTENLIHRFNLEIEEFLKIKSTINKSNVVINRGSILKEVSDFKDRFPNAYNPNDIYLNAISELNEHVNNVYDEISQLETIKIPNKKNIMYTYVLSNRVKKLISFKE